MPLLGLTFNLYVNNKLLHIRTWTGALFQGSSRSETEHSKLVPRPPFPFKVSEGREKPWRKKIVKCKQTNKQEINWNKSNFLKEFWAETFLGVVRRRHFLHRNLFLLSYFIWFILSRDRWDSITYRPTQGLCLSFHFRREKRPRLNDGIIHFKCTIWKFDRCLKAYLVLCNILDYDKDK